MCKFTKLGPWLMVLIVPALLLALLVLAGCGEEKKEQTGIGVSCLRDKECNSGLICAATNTCATCTPCKQRSDCTDGYYCNQERGCCKKTECSDFSCAEPLYCIDDVCRKLPCTAAEEAATCTHPNHYCFNDFCAKKQCVAHADCTTALCDLANYVCKKCEIDADCPDPTTQTCNLAGDCTENTASDGDTSLPKLGCEEFQQNCLFATLTCFAHMPSDTFSSCNTTKNTEGGIESYAFSFTDGSIYKMIQSPANTYEAYGKNGTFCYKMTLDQQNGLSTYYNKAGELLGTYTYNAAGSVVTISCPGAADTAYNLQDLNAGCNGFPGPGVYIPPAPGIEKCN